MWTSQTNEAHVLSGCVHLNTDTWLAICKSVVMVKARVSATPRIASPTNVGGALTTRVIKLDKRRDFKNCEWNCMQRHSAHLSNVSQLLASNMLPGY